MGPLPRRALLRSLALACLAAPWAGRAWAEDMAPPAWGRTEALEALGSPEPDLRRRAAVLLGKVGLMSDTEALVAALRDEDEVVRGIAQSSLWALWSRHGDPEVDQLFTRGVEHMGWRRFAEAEETFSRIVARAPEFAEGWNKRATVRFLAGNLAGSAADCEETLARNPWHFGALSGAGMVAWRRGRPDAAEVWFERALAINPQLEGVASSLRQLRRERAARRDREA